MVNMPIALEYVQFQWTYCIDAAVVREFGKRQVKARKVYVRAVASVSSASARTLDVPGIIQHAATRLVHAGDVAARPVTPIIPHRAAG